MVRVFRLGGVADCTLGYLLVHLQLDPAGIGALHC